MERCGNGFFYIEPHLGQTIERNHHVGSKDGWLVVLQPSGRFPPRRFYLLNPVTGATISLPPLPPRTSATGTVKALLTCSPDDEDDEDDPDRSCLVVILFRTSFAWCNVFSSPAQGGRRRWQFKSTTGVSDAACFGGKLYALPNSNQTHILCHDLTAKSGSSSKAQPAKEEVTIPFSPTILQWEKSRHLAHFHDGTDDQLLLVLRRWEEKFCVYKLVIIKGNNNRDEISWEEVRSLDGYALFLSSHQSFSLRVANNDGGGGGGIESNSIYFAFTPWGFHSGIFNLETEQLTRFNHNPMISERKLRSFWFLPMPWDIPKLTKDPERMVQLLKNKNRPPKFYHYHGMIKIKTSPGHNRFQSLSSFDSNSDDEEGYDDDDDDDENEVSSVVVSSKENRTKGKKKKKKKTVKNEKS